MEFGVNDEAASLIRLGNFEKMVEKRYAKLLENEVKALLVLESLAQLLPKNWKIHLLGSVAIGIQSDDSDVDVYVCQSKYDYFSIKPQYKRASNIEDVVKLLEDGQEKEEKLFEVREVVLKARIPIARLTHRFLKVKVDLSASSGIGVQNSRLLRMYLDSDHRVKWLVLLIHEWTKEIEVLGNAPKFRPYAMTWLVIFFLMNTSPRIVHPVKEMQENKPQYLISGWNCQFCKTPKTENNQSKQELLFAFLKFLVKTDFSTNIICTNTGTLIQKTALTIHLFGSLPSFILTLKQVSDLKENMKIKVSGPICILDPFELNHIISRQVSKAVLSKLVLLAMESLKAKQLILK